MAKSKATYVPKDVVERYHPSEIVSHELVLAQGSVCLWKSTLERKQLDLPTQVHYHLIEDGDGIAMLISGEECALDNFNIAVWQAGSKFRRTESPTS